MDSRLRSLERECIYGGMDEQRAYIQAYERHHGFMAPIKIVRNPIPIWASMSAIMAFSEQMRFMANESFISSAQTVESLNRLAKVVGLAPESIAKGIGVDHGVCGTAKSDVAVD